MNWVLYIVSSRFNKKAASVSEGRFAFSNLIYGCGVAGGGVGGVGLGLTGIYNLAAESIWFSRLFAIPLPSKRHQLPNSNPVCVTRQRLPGARQDVACES